MDFIFPGGQLYCKKNWKQIRVAAREWNGECGVREHFSAEPLREIGQTLGNI